MGEQIEKKAERRSFENGQKKIKRNKKVYMKERQRTTNGKARMKDDILCKVTHS